MFQFPPLPPGQPHHRRVLYAFVAVFAAIEIVFQLSDLGILPPGLRWRAYLEFAFMDQWWDAWLAGERVPPQTRWMAFTYAFLHGGMTHLLMNSAAFLGLGLVTMRIFGARLFLLFFVVTALGGSIAYGMIAHSQQPMIGASGVVFGLIGVLKYAEFVFITRQGGGSMRPFLASLGALVLINVILWLAMGGMLAWETHLGGFLAGWAAAWAVVPKAGRGGSEPPPVRGRMAGRGRRVP